MPYILCQHIKTDGIRCGSPALRTKTYCFYHHDLTSRLHAVFLFHLKLSPNSHNIRDFRHLPRYPRIRCSQPPATRAWSIPIHLARILQQRLLLLRTQPSIRVMHTVLKPTRTHEL